MVTLPQEFKGEEKRYKAILEINKPGFSFDKEIETPYVEDTFERMLNELDHMELEIIINGKRNTIYLKVERKDEYNINLIIEMTAKMKEYKSEREKFFEKLMEDKDMIELAYIEEVIEDFTKEINNFLIAVGISYPGLLELYNMKLYLDDKEYSYLKKIASSLSISVGEAKRDKWPQIVVIDIKKTWNWLRKREGFLKGMPTNSIERALSAFSYLYDCYTYEDLFYAMIGIEAIYVKNKEGILQQIKEKSKALFGEPSDYMKRLKYMYNVRSRFIHGELNFPPRYYTEENGSTQEFKEFVDDEYFDSKNFAQAILIASIQQHVLRDKDEIEFEIKVKNE